MRTFLTFLFWAVLGVFALAAALFGYFIYTPRPEPPALLGEPREGEIDSGGRQRTYLIYAPRNLAPQAPLVIALHGSAGSSGQMRVQSGYAFERLADEHGFALVYPDGFEGYWNACNIAGDYSANTLDIDDVGFLTALADKLAADLGADPARTFVVGVSRGGHMAFRLALEAPERFRAVAAIAANVPAPENFKCDAAEQGTASVMIMNGTNDPLNPFEGGEVRLFGMFGRGAVLSSRQSGEFFADLNGMNSAPEASTREAEDRIRVESVLWRSDAGEVELMAIHGGGHVIPQPYARAPRLLGRTPRDPNGPAEIVAFFLRQSVLDTGGL